MAQKPAIPKGTRDFSPIEMERRNYIFNTITRVYKLYGFKQIETPAMENLSTLLGKYGDEGDKLLFKILNSGDFLAKADEDLLQQKNSSALMRQLASKGLRYDLTVPFARYVVQHRNEITFPFKRFQIQPVWRADRPQRGRYREFYQCDSDVIGSTSMLNEMELVQIMDEVFRRLNIPVTIKINNRKLLAGIAEAMNASQHLTDITIALDKTDKIGITRVFEELKAKGLATDSLGLLEAVVNLQELDNRKKLNCLREMIGETGNGAAGMAELAELFELLDKLTLHNTVSIDLTLARGLNYYTGAIFEVTANEVKMGSICGGGRYDDLTGIFGLKEVSGVGMSFGADRIYDILLETDGFPASSQQHSRVLAVNFGEKESAYVLPLLAELRAKGISTELYPDAAKMKKQMNYADKNNIPYVVMAGEDEMKQGLFKLKNMLSGQQQVLGAQELIKNVSH